MVQVTMTGPEYAELLEKERMLDDLVSRHVADRRFNIPKGSVSSYQTGEFSSNYEFPSWLQQILLKDMEEQLLAMPDNIFVRMVKSEHCYYNPQEKVFRAAMYSGTRGFVNMREYSKKISKRWDTMLQRLDVGERVDEEEEAKDGE